MSPWRSGLIPQSWYVSLFSLAIFEIESRSFQVAYIDLIALLTAFAQQEMLRRERTDEAVALLRRKVRRYRLGPYFEAREASNVLPHQNENI